MACPGRQHGGMHCRSEPHQEGVPASSPRRGTPPTSTPAAGPEQLQPLQVIGGELDPSEILRDGPARQVRVVRRLGVGVMLVSPWSPRSSDVTTIRCPRPGVPQGGLGLDRGCLVTETSPDDLGVSGSMGRCPPDHDPVAGTGHHPTRMISRRPRPGRISPLKGVVSLPQGAKFMSGCSGGVENPKPGREGRSPRTPRRGRRRGRPGRPAAR